MKFIARFKWDILIFLAISILFVSLRLPNLTLQPIFADEAIYIRWAQVMKAEPTLRFLPLSDGKTPLYMWTLMPLFKVFEDPLFAGRFLSIMSGFVTMLGVLFLGYKFLNRRVGFFAALLVAITPYMVFFDRMALVDSMLAAFTIWALNFSLLLVKYPRNDLAMVLGYLLGGALLTKTPATVNFLVVPTTILVAKWTKDTRQWVVLNMFKLWVIAFVIAMAIYNILRLGPGFTNLNSRNQDYIFSPDELITRPWDPFLPHLGNVTDWFPKLLTPPILLFILLGILYVIFAKKRYGWILLLWSLIPLIILMTFLRQFTARYLLFTIPPLLILGAIGIDFFISRLKIAKHYLVAIVLLAILPFALYFNYLLVTDPIHAPLPNDEKRGYLEDWTAGYGLREIASYLDQKSKERMVVVGTEGYFGTLPDGLQIYLDKNRQVIIKGGKAVDIHALRPTALEHPTYFIFNRQTQDISSMNNDKLIMQFIKPDTTGIPQHAVSLYEVNPSSSSGELRK